MADRDSIHEQDIREARASEKPAHERQELFLALRNSKASWQTDGRGVRGDPLKHGTPQAVSPQGRFPLKVEQSFFQPSFPEATSTETTAAEEGSDNANANEYGFELEVDSIDNDAVTVDIHVGYGEINDTPPTGMTGADDYILTISVDGTEIYAIVTYDTDSLAITSRSLAFAASVPDSTFGTLYVPIGFIDIAYNGDGKITEVNPHNRHCGDINISFVYGAANAAPALFELVQFADAVALS